MAIIRFFFVSAGGVFVDITIAYAIATMLGTPLWIAAAVGFSVAACGNYILHEIWTLNTIARFPVRLEEGLTTELGVSVVNDSSANEAFRILSCSAAAVPMEFDFLFQKRGSGLYVTDENWDESIARRWAGFIVRDYSSNRLAFVVGERVDLGNGETRAIIRTEDAWPFIRVFLDGEVLNTDEVMSPAMITVVR